MDTIVLIGIVIFIIYINYSSNKQPQTQKTNCPLQEQNENGECVELKQINEHMPINKVKVVPFVANIELYTDVLLTDSTILQSNTPDDSSFNNQDVLQQHEKDRFSSLVFG